MTKITLREVHAHRQSVDMAPADVARYLADVFGQKLVAYMAGVGSPDTVRSWTSEGVEPRDEAKRRLQLAMQVFQLLQQDESDHTVRAWFVGLNPQLDDRSPAEAIREGDLRDVLLAAKSFLQGG